MKSVNSEVTINNELSNISEWLSSNKLSHFKVLEKCTKNLIGHSRLAFNNHESNIDC